MKYLIKYPIFIIYIVLIVFLSPGTISAANNCSSVQVEPVKNKNADLATMTINPAIAKTGQNITVTIIPKFFDSYKVDPGNIFTQHFNKDGYFIDDKGYVDKSKKIIQSVSPDYGLFYYDTSGSAWTKDGRENTKKLSDAADNQVFRRFNWAVSVQCGVIYKSYNAVPCLNKSEYKIVMSSFDTQNGIRKNDIEYSVNGYTNSGSDSHTSTSGEGEYAFVDQDNGMKVIAEQHSSYSENNQIVLNLRTEDNNGKKIASKLSITTSDNLTISSNSVKMSGTNPWNIEASDSGTYSFYVTNNKSGSKKATITVNAKSDFGCAESNEKITLNFGKDASSSGSIGYSASSLSFWDKTRLYLNDIYYRIKYLLSTILELSALALVGYFIYRYVKKRKAAAMPDAPQNQTPSANIPPANTRTPIPPTNIPPAQTSPPPIPPQNTPPQNQPSTPPTQPPTSSS